jgi:hypothetical protein
MGSVNHFFPTKSVLHGEKINWFIIAKTGHVFFPQANIHSIMESEEQVLELMVLLDQGLQEAVKIEEKLDDYETKLQASTAFSSEQQHSAIGRNSEVQCELNLGLQSYPRAIELPSNILKFWLPLRKTGFKEK